MSAVAWSPSEVPAPPGYAVPPRTEQPRLVLVPTGQPASARGAGGLRVTRAGRLVLTVLVLLLLAAAVAAGVARASSGPAAGAVPVGAPRVTVQAGQTLSEIAARHLSGMSLDEAVTAIVLANELPSTQVAAGQRLVIPRS
ncbi:MAG TPA: LysM peptidoglycan-binding domain-containing protein [Dermatophilaceae bacterium]|nr:LysM peptidoglycan-binding domain-containing protein [Dermatophilaceae bacterium]